MSAVRRRKQLLYGAGFMVVLLLLLSGGVALVAQPDWQSSRSGPEPTPSFQPIAVESVSVVDHGKTVDVVATLRNPNTRAGVGEYHVTFIFKGDGGHDVGRRTETTYVLPGSLQFVTALSVPVSGPIVSAEVEIPPEPSFMVLPETLDLPTFGSFLRERSTRVIGDQPFEEQKGLVRNNGTFDFLRVELVALARDGEGKVVGVGKTFVGELTVGEQREYTVLWPQPQSPTANVTVLPTTNLFREENLIKVIGDPSSLR